MDKVPRFEPGYFNPKKNTQTVITDFLLLYSCTVVFVSLWRGRFEDQRVYWNCLLNFPQRTTYETETKEGILCCSCTKGVTTNCLWSWFYEWVTLNEASYSLHYLLYVSFRTVNSHTAWVKHAIQLTLKQNTLPSCMSLFDHNYSFSTRFVSVLLHLPRKRHLRSHIISLRVTVQWY